VRPRALAATALVATICVAAGAAPAAAHPPASQRLSNETTFTQWAGAALPVTVYEQPTTRSRRVGRLRFLTEDGFPEVYVLRAERADVAGIA
jgi:hypothetical protein